MPENYGSSKITVVTSKTDENQQVISESLASNTPVACAADITGGAFQINRNTGEIFEPDSQNLSKSLLKMMRNLKEYQPRKNCITLEESAEQIERICQ